MKAQFYVSKDAACATCRFAPPNTMMGNAFQRKLAAVVDHNGNEIDPNYKPICAQGLRLGKVNCGRYQAEAGSDDEGRPERPRIRLLGPYQGKRWWG